MNIQSRLISFLRTAFITYVLSALLLLIFAFIMYKCKLQESQMKIGVYAIYTISCLVGGFFMGKITRQKRFFFGLLFGVLYFLFLVILSLIVNQSFIQGMSHALMILAFCSLGGMIGGMIS